MLDHPIILIIVVAAALLRWFFQKSQTPNQDSERPTVPGQPIPRSEETQTEEERIRRFLEALGQPAGSAPPPKVAPKEVKPRLFPTLPPLTTVPPPLPPPPVPVAVEPPPVPVMRRVFTPAAVSSEAGFEVRDLGAPPPGEALPETRRLTEQPGLLVRLRSSQGLRDAIILREIFGPPRSLQPLNPIGEF